MSLRFQKRKKLLPGASVNLSKSSASISGGVRGARLSLGARGIRGSVGIPGSGISLTSLGIGRMGGIGAIFAVFVLLALASFQIAWLVFKSLLQLSIWTVSGIARLLSLALASRPNQGKYRSDSQVKRSATRRKK